MGKISTLKRIDFNKGYFDANGVRYHIYDSVSFGRYKEYVKFQHYFAYGTTPQQVYESDKQNLAHLSGPALFLGVHKVMESLLNRIESFENFVDSEYDRYFEFCTLFVNREDEDLTTWTKSLAASKIDDWNKGLLDPADFFFLAGNMSNELRRKYSLLPHVEGSDQGKDEAKRRSQENK